MPANYLQPTKNFKGNFPLLSSNALPNRRHKLLESNYSEAQLEQVFTELLKEHGYNYINS